MRPSPQPQIARSQRLLRTARLCLEDGDPGSCVSKAYYALFHQGLFKVEE